MDRKSQNVFLDSKDILFNYRDKIYRQKSFPRNRLILPKTIPTKRYSEESLKEILDIFVEYENSIPEGNLNNYREFIKASAILRIEITSEDHLENRFQTIKDILKEVLTKDVFSEQSPQNLRLRIRLIPFLWYNAHFGCAEKITDDFRYQDFVLQHLEAYAWNDLNLIGKSLKESNKLEYLLQKISLDDVSFLFRRNYLTTAPILYQIDKQTLTLKPNTHIFATEDFKTLLKYINVY